MTLKTLFLGLSLVLLLAIAWSQRNSPAVQALLRSREVHAPNIRFDNGSVRDTSAASELASAPSDKPLSVTGVRKCARGATVVYTDKTCPPGSKQLAIANGTVNVVDNNAPAGGRPAADAAKPGKPAAGRPAEPSLREKYMEAVINQ